MRESIPEPGLLTLKNIQTAVAVWMVKIERHLKSVIKGDDKNLIRERL